jgi:hypothetical protein
MRTKYEVIEMVRKIEEFPELLDKHMQGYLNALKWVLNEPKEA